MKKPVEICPDIYWVGAVDWNERNFHGYTTDRGSTYNAYLIMDEKITLVDTVKATFSDDLIERISAIVDPSKIDYVIANHVEMDHSGSLPKVMELAPHAEIVCSEGAGEKGLLAHYGAHAYHPVKTGDTLSIGKRTLSFVQTKMVHWPDNMVTYDAADKVLFSNDAFGQHYASGKRFDSEVDLAEVMQQAKKYYANIVMPYGKMAAKAVEACSGLDIATIAPAHGIIWREHIDTIMEAYRTWTSLSTEEYALVVYDSMWHSTEKMAQEVLDAFVEAGVPTRLFDLKVNHISDIMTEVLSARYLAVGSPTLNSGMLPTVAAFLCYLKGLCPKGRDVIGVPFGSYGWAPLGPKGVAEGLEAAGYQVPTDAIAMNWIPTEESLADLHAKVAGIIGK